MMMIYVLATVTFHPMRLRVRLCCCVVVTVVCLLSAFVVFYVVMTLSDIQCLQSFVMLRSVAHPRRPSFSACLVGNNISNDISCIYFVRCPLQFFDYST